MIARMAAIYYIPLRNKIQIESPAMASPQDLLDRIALRLRRERQAQGLTQAALAERSGVSPRMLALVEKAETNPSIATLAEIAGGLGIGFAELVAGGEDAPAQVIAPPDFATMWQGPAGQARLLASGGAAELWDWTLVADGRYDASPDPAGTIEMILVLEGTLVLEVDENVLTVPAGHAVRLASDRPYAYRATGGTLRLVKVVGTAGRR
jgi:transcriptional regulator with XRE-family HTH domain